MPKIYVCNNFNLLVVCSIQGSAHSSDLPSKWSGRRNLDFISFHVCAVKA